MLGSFYKITFQIHQINVNNFKLFDKNSNFYIRFKA